MPIALPGWPNGIGTGWPWRGGHPRATRNFLGTDSAPTPPVQGIGLCCAGNLQCPMPWKANARCLSRSAA